MPSIALDRIHVLISLKSVTLFLSFSSRSVSILICIAIFIGCICMHIAHTSRASFHFQQLHHLQWIRWWSRWAHELFNISSIIFIIVVVGVVVAVVIIVGAGADTAYILQNSSSHIHIIPFFSVESFLSAQHHFREYFIVLNTK